MISWHAAALSGETTGQRWIACDLRRNIVHVASLFCFISLLYDELYFIVYSIFPRPSYGYSSGKEAIV